MQSYITSAVIMQMGQTEQNIVHQAQVLDDKSSRFSFIDTNRFNGLCMIIDPEMKKAAK